jgi:hypothetical protein
MPLHQVDDILIAVSVNQPGATQSASGWTPICSTTTPNVSFWWKRATATNDAGPTITAASTDQFSICYIIRNCIKTGTPWEDARVNGNPITTPPLTGALPQTDTTPTTDFATVSGPNRLVIAFGAADSNATWASGNPPAGWTQDNIYSASGTTAGFWVIYKSASANVSGLNMGTLTGANNSGVLTLSLLPIPDTFKQNIVSVGPMAVKRAASF